jgi:hypothetical protein
MVNYIVELQVPSAVTMIVTACWDVTLVVLGGDINFFTGTCCLHFLGGRALYLQHCSFVPYQCNIVTCIFKIKEYVA